MTIEDVPQDERVRVDTSEDSSRPSGGVPGTDPLASDALGGEPPPIEEAEVGRLRAKLMSRLLGVESAAPRLGRFVLLERLGEGGMGVVFAAYDPELDRKIAVKLLRRDQTDASVRKRMVREAQSMAKLSHPNVAQIYEVGEHEGGTFIAMEFVRGETLRAWQQQERRGWREVLDVYLQAGRGLAAAHAVGLVHRDFKPDNAIVGRDGRVRVLDFGLARTGEVETTNELETQTVQPAPHDDALGTPLTHDGAVMGTPAYMAPEQFLGEEVTARADQFGFCVALWEGLFGERPFAGTTRADLIGNVTRGRLREVPKATRVPAWVRTALARGLSVGPADRFESTEALLAALANDPLRRRRRIFYAGATVLTIGLIAAGVDGTRRYQRAQAIAGCEATGASIDEVWNDDARARVRESMLATGLNYAPTTAEKVMPWLDRQAGAWREYASEACMNVHVDGTWEPELLDRAMWCLDERRLELASLVTTLEHADTGRLLAAVDAASRLPLIAPCANATTLSSLAPPPDPDARAAISEVRAEIARARTLSWADEPAGALDVIRAARTRAEALAWPAVSSAAREFEGELLARVGSFAEAESALIAAYTEAAKARAWDVADAAATSLVRVVGTAQRRPAEGQNWALHAEVAATHAGDPLGVRDSERSMHLSTIHNDAGAYDRATALAERVLAIRERVLGPDHPNVAAAANHLGSVHLAAGRYGDAEALLERALTIWERALGADHPDLAFALGNLAGVHVETGDYEAAKPLMERALAIDEKALGPDDPAVAASLVNLAIVHVHQGNRGQAKALFERALAIHTTTFGAEHPTVATSLSNLAGVQGNAGASEDLIRRALEIREKALGPDHPDVAASLYNFADALTSRDQHGEAKTHATRALAIYEKTLGPDHPSTADVMCVLARIHSRMGAHAEAEALLERALAAGEKTLGPEHALLAYALGGLAELALERSRPADAVPFAERAVSVCEAGGAPADLLAEARVMLARALWDAPHSRGRDRARAVALAAAARDALRGSEGGAEQLAEVEAWIAAHRLEAGDSG